jgi:large repetitive protein
MEIVKKLLKVPLIIAGLIVAMINNNVVAQSSGTLLRIIDLTSSSYPAITNQSVSFTIATSVNTSLLTFSYEFGDGAPGIQSSKTNTVSHVYTKSGRYFLTVRATDSAGNSASKDFAVTVMDQSTVQSIQKGQQSSSSIIYDLTDKSIWVVNPDNDSLSKISSESGASIEFPIEDKCHPTSLALDKNRSIWVACQKTDKIVSISQNGTVLKKIDTGYGSTPFGIASSPDGSFLYATLYGKGSLISINADANTVTNSLRLGETPRAIAVTSDNRRLLITRHISTDDNGVVWDVANNQGALTLSRTIFLKEDKESIRRENLGMGVPNYLSSIVIHPSGRKAYVTAKKDDVNHGLFLSGEDLVSDHTVRAMIAEIDLTTNQESIYTRFDIDNSDSPSALAFSPFGDYLLVALQGNSILAAFDLLATDRTPNSITPTRSSAKYKTLGIAPQGAVVDTTTMRAFVNNFMSRNVGVFPLRRFFINGDVDVASTQFVAVQPSKEKLSPSVLLGKQVFYDAMNEKPDGSQKNRMSAEGYISCATCHIDGGHDGRTWDFTGRGEGMRNTTDLRGRSGMGHGRVHWSGNFDEIQDFENDIRNAFGGAGFLSDNDFINTQDTLGRPKKGLSKELDALAEYVTSLNNSSLPRSPYRNPDGSMTQKGILGQAVFSAQGCQSCHSGSSFTESTLSNPILRDVGTITAASGKRLNQQLTGIDTPTLLGIWNTAPYLHDGSARTLNDVFTQSNQNGKEADAHRKVLRLTANEKENLFEFLLQLDGSSTNINTPVPTPTATARPLATPTRPVITGMSPEIERIINLLIKFIMERLSIILKSPSLSNGGNVRARSLLVNDVSRRINFVEKRVKLEIRSGKLRGKQALERINISLKKIKKLSRVLSTDRINHRLRSSVLAYSKTLNYKTP